MFITCKSYRITLALKLSSSVVVHFSTPNSSDNFQLSHFTNMVYCICPNILDVPWIIKDLIHFITKRNSGEWAVMTCRKEAAEGISLSNGRTTRFKRGKEMHREGGKEFIVASWRDPEFDGKLISFPTRIRPPPPRFKRNLSAEKNGGS
jgi:hypothetical protein